MPSIHFVTAAISSLAGAGSTGGGILPVMSLSRTLSQSSGFLAAELSSVNADRLRFAELSFSLWQPTQSLARKGCTAEPKVAPLEVTCERICPPRLSSHTREIEKPKTKYGAAQLFRMIGPDFIKRWGRQQAVAGSAYPIHSGCC